MNFSEFIFIPEDKNKPIKVVYENDGLIEVDDCTIEYTRRLSPTESEWSFPAFSNIFKIAFKVSSSFLL